MIALHLMRMFLFFFVFWASALGVYGGDAGGDDREGHDGDEPALILEEITEPKEKLWFGLKENGETGEIVCKAKTKPAGGEAKIVWTVTVAGEGDADTPDVNAEPNKHEGAEFKFKAKTTGIRKITAQIGNSSQSITITVFRVVLENEYTAERGAENEITASTEPAELEGEWTYTWSFTGGRGGTKTSTDKKTKVILVDGENEYTVTVSLSSEIAASPAEDKAALGVEEREWEKMTLECKPDTLTDAASPFRWTRGNRFTTGQGGTLGLFCDEEKSTPSIIVPNPTQGGGKKWRDGYELTAVADTNGPNNEYRYIDNHTFAVKSKSMVSSHLKSDGPRPQPAAGMNWYTRNNHFAEDKVKAVLAHEYKGQGEGGIGHYGEVEKFFEEEDNDVSSTLEVMYATHEKTENAFRAEIEACIKTFNDAAYAAANKVHDANTNYPTRYDASYWIMLSARYPHYSTEIVDGVETIVKTMVTYERADIPKWSEKVIICSGD